MRELMLQIAVYILCVAWGLSLLAYAIGTQNHREWRNGNGRVQRPRR